MRTAFRWLRQRPRAALHATSLITALAMAPAAPAAATTHEHIRDGWFVGVGVGGGSAALTVDGETSDREGGAAAGLRGGYVVNPQLAFGLESNLWWKSENGVEFTLTTYTAALTWFPTAGLLIRGGIGGGDADAEQQIGSTTYTASESGLGLVVGAGYEFRVARSFAFGPQLDFNYVDVESLSANYVNLGIGFHWYFIPR